MTELSKNLGTAPRTRDDLAAFVERVFGLRVPRARMCPGHDTPLDYLVRSFLGQEDLVVWANRGGGKTTMAAVATLLDGIYRAPAAIRVLGGSFDQSDRLGETIRQMASRRTGLVAGAMTRDRVRLTNGSDIRMLAQSQRAVRGQHVQRIRCDEVDLFDAEVWRAVQFATRSAGASRGSIEVLSTMHRPGGLMEHLVGMARAGTGLRHGGVSAAPTPGSAPATSRLARDEAGYGLVHWCLWEVIERCEGRDCRTCPLADDCRGRARQADGFFKIDDAIAIQARSSRAAWEAEMLCRGAQREHLVFAEFDPSVHVADVAHVPDWPTYRAIDFGYAAPLVCLWVQLSPDGLVHVIAEYAQARRSMPQHAREILQRDPPGLRPQMTYVDPAGRSRSAAGGPACTELLAAAGIPCASRSSGVAEGLELIRAALAPAEGPARLKIAPSCRQLIQAFKTYHYPPPGAAGDADTPVKDGPDHFIDALRYFFVNRVRPKMPTRRARY